MGLSTKIKDREAVVSVIGLGYVGLPLAVLFAEAGFSVVGIDTDKAKVDSVNRGVSYIGDVLSEKLARVVSNDSAAADVMQPAEPTGTADEIGRLRATLDFDVLLKADVAIICVPTPLGKTKDPDVSYIVSAAGNIAKRLHANMLVVLESTTYPGATEEIIRPRLEAAQECRFEVGKDIFLVFSPERVDPGRTDWTTSNTPKVVGGVTTHCSDMGVALYKSVVEEVVLVSSPKTAEMVKLLENTFRATNIGLVNEMSVMCDRLGIDVWEVIDAAKTKPFGFMPFYPGPGLGGHCLPIDPHYLAWKLKNLDYTARFIQLADEINLGMPLYWVTKAQDELNNRGKPLRNSKVLVLGVAYKPDIDDARESPAIDVIDHLIEKGADVTYHDSNVPYLDVESGRLSSISDADFWAALADADCVLIVTDHTNYDWVEIQNNASLIVDTRNAMRKGAVSRGTKATG